MTIEANQLHKTFGLRHVVKNVSFAVHPGEVYGLIGPNGAGKTTTLRMVAGLMRPTRGHVNICGNDVVRDADRYKGQIGFLGGSNGLYARLSAAEVLSFYGGLYGLSKSAVEHRIATLTVELQLSAIIDRLCGELSTGQRQRVSLARASIHDPPVLILDEPTASLDVLASQFVAQFIRRQRETGHAIVFSTHYMTEAELLCDRIGLLYGGQLVDEGTPADLKQRFGVDSLERLFMTLHDSEQTTRQDA